MGMTIVTEEFDISVRDEYSGQTTALIQRLDEEGVEVICNTDLDILIPTEQVELFTTVCSNN